MATDSDKPSIKYKELSLKRSSIKGQITKFKNYLTTLESIQLSSTSLAELSLKLNKFETLSTKFEDLQTEMEVLNYQNLDSEINERDGIESEIISGIATAKILIENAKIQSEARRKSLAPATSCHHHHDPDSLGFKLPQIQIAKFDGAYFRWLEFRDTFQTVVHENEHLSDIHKYHYLISYLEEDAARVIANLEVSSSNYKEAWSLLCERYDNKRLLINYHLTELFNIQPLATESERSLRYLVDHVTRNLRALSSLGQPTDKWDVLVIFMLTSKLHSNTLMKWEELRNSLNEVPTLEQFNKFLTNRADVLEALNRGKSDNNNKPQRTMHISNPSTQSRNTYTQNSCHKNQYYNFNSNYRQEKPSYVRALTSNNENNKLTCIICKESHRIYECPTFRNKNVNQRLADVKKYNLCSNCLRQGHKVPECQLGPCRECKQKHNTLLHVFNVTLSNNSSELLTTFSNQHPIQVLLSTVILQVSNPLTNDTENVKALLDCGSQSSFISKNLKQKLQLDTKQIHEINVIGIGNNLCNKINEICNISLKSINTSYNLTLSCLVLDELTGELPKAFIDISNIKIPSHIQLADPNFNKPERVDLILGADVFWNVIGTEQYSLGEGDPKLINSKFGWLIAGPIQASCSKYIQCNNSTLDSSCKQQPNIDHIITKFWETEELPNISTFSRNEQLCEEHFLVNTTRLSTGRFCVKLPLLHDPSYLGESYNLAKTRLLNQEKRFRKNPVLKQNYTDFIREYAELGHLSEATVTKPTTGYFLCHHAVFREDSESTKIRVVFDGSAPTSSGYSLNDILMVGPNVQDSLFSILIRARQYKYLLTGDIEKMYRQVEVHPNDRNLQLILWREDESQPIKTLQLNTVTYGTASASYLSTRCLKQIGEECEDPLIRNIIQNDFYVDDLITGSDSEYELQYIQNSVSEALNSACFTLRKYKSNLQKLFKDVTLNDKLILSEASSTLGLGWNPANDYLHFPIKSIQINTNKCTKRIIMSNSFKIFDPLGLLSPCIIVPKMLLQKLWLLQIDWDEPVPHDIKQSWDDFNSNLCYLSNLNIPRNVICNQPITTEIHSFSDASQNAYGACIYVKSINSNNKSSLKLLCAKSKVAPLKPMTIPRLELCAALLAARLSKAVCESIRYKPTRVFHWCDSSVVLAWIQNVPRNLKTFVANRIGEITEITQPSAWKYVPTTENPADFISRGVNAKQLVNLNLWWYGPKFLIKDESSWPQLKITLDKGDLPEIKSNLSTLTQTIINFENYSNLSKLQRILAYVKRFIHNTKLLSSKRSGTLTSDELTESFNNLCFLAQQQSFPLDYKVLIQNKSLSNKSKILSLSPFIDQNNLIRVGGRLHASTYSYDKKYPILLDASHHLTKLFFHHEHLRLMHAGPQLLLASVRETIWPINGRRLARRIVNNCVVCRRFQGKTLSPKMGNLPAQRIIPDFPFLSVGLDFAGPFFILNRKGRGCRLIKCYLCIFICMRYKCVHLEAVSGLSKDEFIMTLRRFIARRGKPAEIFSDNGRNFVAAAKELGSFLKSNNNLLTDFAASEGIKFKFIPAYSPHFGGLWESGIKSAKHHIKRVMGNSHFTFEELQTLFAQVEAILNSRPLCPLSSSPDDFLSLSPGHFIIGRPLTSVPSPSLEAADPNKLKRYQRLEQLRQHFWQRWQKEYITELQQRQKWMKQNADLHVGDLVLIKEDYLPPLCWRLGRVTRLFPGPDEITRVADINTSTGCVRRSLVRLCPLPKPNDTSG